MKLRVAWLGRPAASPYESDIESYRLKVSHRWPAEDRKLRPASGGRESDPLRALRRERELLERLVEPGWTVVGLDERGRSFDSPGFARWLENLADGGVPGVLFTIGSDLGLERAFLERADLRLALSAFTLPHLLARLLLWEQLFRATQILGGGSYHRDVVQ